ncbi:MAG: hypothetical protein KAI70_03715 [Candidatus Omnitrophica bacterium]|nr:hypothetical protein [Candidatus Omnitrophota bacterium]
MDYKLLFIFIEGNDDKRFFESVVEPFLRERYSEITFYKYAKKNKKIKASFINSINSMKADYICVGDIDEFPCITTKKEKLTKDFGKKITVDTIAVVIKEMEGWYLAGLDKKASKKIGIREKIGTTDNITKERFNQLIPKQMPRPVFMQKILENYDVELAEGKNRSFGYFLNKWMNDRQQKRVTDNHGQIREDNRDGKAQRLPMELL